MVGQFWIDKALSAPIYILLVPLVEFAGIPFLLLLVWRAMRRIDHLYFVAAAAYFVLTYFVGFAGLNNLSMRGMFLPSFVLFYLFAKYSPAIGDRLARWTGRRWVVAGASLLFVVVTTIGVFKMSGAMLQGAWLSTTLAYRDAEAALPKTLTLPYRAIVFDRDLKSYVPTKADRIGSAKYNTEKFIDTLTIEEMLPWEKELLRQPRNGLY